METAAAPSLKQFIIRPWVWHFVFTLICAVLLLLIIRPQYADRTANRSDFLLNLGALVVCWVHTVLILIFSMRRFSRKQIVPGLIYFTHFLASAFLGFYAYMMLNIGWIYALKR